ncbi:MAG: diguanylate cyclase [Spirochaetes bacterium]|nr:diguanylate cyclase [Spirochaetota bacterium]MBU0956333.1 diguanylate cyclase [Spirochaetota bacterium]
MPDKILVDMEILFSEISRALEDRASLSVQKRKDLTARMRATLKQLQQSAERVDSGTKELEELNRRLSQAYEVIEKSDVVVFEWALILDVPAKFVTDNVRRYGYTPEDFYSGSLKDYWDFIHPDDRDAARSLVHGMRERRATEYKHRYRVLCRNGELRWVEENTVLEYNDKGEAIRERGILYDITNIKNTDEKIEYLSYHDKLTGLYNRAWFDEQVKLLELRQQFPFTVILGDMNGLKVTNDLFGHKAGDQLLVAVAGVLRSACRESDSVCRLGGDEFVILLPGFAEAAARKVCNRINRKCQELHLKPVNPSIALGFATCHGPEDSIDLLLSTADDRMYRNKLEHAGTTQSLLSRSMQSGLQDKTHESLEHVQLVRRVALALGKLRKLTSSTMEILDSACLMHDIGKSSLPDSILCKAGPLSDDEWTQVRKHPEYGCKILSGSANLQAVGEIVLHHHERWDGSGYPDGQASEAIPLLSRILTLADAWAVIRHEQVYQSARDREQAAAELRRCSGSQFDPSLVDQFLAMLPGMDDI